MANTMKIAIYILCLNEYGLYGCLITLSAMGGAGPSIAWHTLFAAPGGLLGHNIFDFNHFTVKREDKLGLSCDKLI